MKKKKIIRLNSISCILLVIHGLVTNFAINNPQQIEQFYSRGIYPKVSFVLTSIANSLPFSFGEVIISCFIIFLIYRAVKLVIACFNKQWREWVVFLTILFFIISVNVVYYDVAWGLNHYRQDIEEIIKLDDEEITLEELVVVYEDYVVEVNRIRENLEEDERGIVTGVDKQTILSEAYKGFESLHKIYPFISADKVIAKGLFSSYFQSRSSYAGVYLYFVGEPNVNDMPPAFSLPATVCHEIAHQKGFAKEDEANYLGFLACREHENPFFNYSGYLLACTYLENAIYKSNKEVFYQIETSYSEKVRKDLVFEREFWRSYVDEQSRAFMNEVNDAYLKANNQKEGVINYSKVVELLVRDYRKRMEKI